MEPIPVSRRGFREITFDFGRDVGAFGADFGDVSSLFATVTTAMGAETFDIAAVSGSDGFFGLTSASSFNSVKFTTEAGVFLFGGTVPFGGETFNVDNLALAQLAIPSAVPLPAARPMLAAGLGALGVARRRKRPKKS